jgi:glycosyltransferase involved in cell wall biosynthesis
MIYLYRRVHLPGPCCREETRFFIRKDAMHRPLISIITPTSNASRSVEQCLRSVIGQHYRPVEHIFIDNMSEDATASIILEYQQHHAHIRLVREKDRGLYDAINKGLDLCTGAWIFILGSDDEFFDDRVLEDLADQGYFDEEQVVYGNVILRGDTPWAKDNTIYDGPFTLEKLYRTNICHQSIFYPRSVISRIGHYSEKYPVTADWDYNFHCFALYKFTYADRIIAWFNGGGRSSMADEHSFFKDMPGKVISYFQLNPEDRSLHRPGSPFYYPVSAYRLANWEQRSKNAHGT